MRANAALGAWLVGPGARESVMAAGALPDAVDRNIQARLDHQRSQDGQGVERLDAGILVYASLDGRAAGLCLPADSSTGEKAAALRDLARYLDLERLRPVVAQVAREQGSPMESPESVAFRLAHQLERLLGVETCVALPRPGGVAIGGVAARSDQRLVGAPVEAGSALEQTALGRTAAMAGVVAPFGTVVPDRRRRTEPAFVCAIPGPSGPVGAVAVWTPGGEEPAGPVLAGFRAALTHVSPILHRALEHARESEAAVRDPLTKLLNRSGLERMMRLVTTPTGSLLYADIDHFKRLNDSHGHAAGDAALVHVSRVFMQGVRDEDAVARIGGEEFAIWLPHTSLERGRQVAERLRQALSYSEWKWQGEKWPLRASFGVASCPESTATREGLARLADRALYQAKQQGRNAVVVAS